MMCVDALDQLMEAEASDLAGMGGTSLALHVRACPRCGPMAAQLLEGQRVLGAVLDAVQPRTPASRVIRHGSRLRRGGWWLGVAPFLAAAGITALLVIGLHEPTPVYYPRHILDRPNVSVRVSPGHNAAVLRTADPRVTIVWIL